MRLTIVLTLAGALALPTSAAAAPITFDGTCQMDGRVTLDAPMGIVPAATNGYGGTLRGGCSGTLRGAPVADTPVRARFRTDELASSCFSSVGTRGSLRLSFPGHGRIPLRFTNVQQAMRITDSADGLALGIGTAYTQLGRQEPDLAAQCVAGGVSGFRLDVLLRTVAPVSAR